MDEKKEIEKIYSLSPMQQGMLFYWLIHKDADIANDPYYRCSTFIIKGKLDIPLFEKSFNLLIRRYDVLRTIFVYEKIQKPKQVVLKKVQAVINFEDLSGLKMGTLELEQYLSEKKEEDKQIGFDLGRGLLLRVSIFKTAGDNYVLVWSYHHIIMDGWCLGILYSEVMSIYSGLRSGTQAILPPVHAYRDYIKWIESFDKEKSLEYWKDYLEGFEVKTGFPWGKGPGKDDKYVHGEYFFPVERSYTKSLARLSEEYQITVGSVFQTLWGVLLQKLNNTDDVVYGTVVSGRPPEVEGIERMVGLFINTVPFRLHAGGESSFVDCLKEVHREDILKKMKEYIPLVEILDLSPLKRNLFDHIMAFQNFPIQDAVSKSESGSQLGFTVENVESVEQTNYNFFLTIAPAEVFIIKFVFNAWLYDRGDIEKMGSYFLELVKQVVETVGIRIKDISILPVKEKERLVYELNNINPGDTLGEGYRCDKSTHQLFAGQVERIPDNIAVIGISTSEIKNLRSGNQESSFQVTYRELDYQSGRLSCILREKGVEADTIAAIKIERSVEMIIGIMGILKAGGAYLPIDSNYPQERINYMIKDSNVKVLIRNKSEIRNPKFETNPNVQKINDQNKHIEDLTVLNFENLNLNSIKGCPRRGLSNFEFPVSDLNSANLAYVIYTSGTTGKPKGAAIEHRSLVNRLNWMQKKYPIDINDTILQKTTFTFDVSVWEIFWWSIVGAKLCLLEPGGEKDPQIITQTIERHNVTTMHFVPSMLSVFLDYLKTSGHAKKLAGLKYVIASGEALLPAHVGRFNELLKKENGAKLANLYGPTEATIDVSYFDCLEVSEIIPIGKPIDNIGLYILDKYLNIQSAAIPGELCISGIGLARGYLNRPELTAEKFLSVPAMFPATKKIYKTGDLARWLPNGNIEFLGRIDHQIKIRGFRVELEEIENRLANHPGIKEAVVLAREDREGDKYLCAYIVSEREYSSSELREYLLQELPDYMVPAYFMTLESIPLTSNGKVARKNLPGPEKQSIGTGVEYTPPVSETEKKLVRIWENILSMEKIGIKDNFFDVGGDSIKIIGVVNLINKEFNSNIKTAAVYANNTIEKIAALIDSPDNGAERGLLKKIEQEFDVLKQHVFNEMEDPGLVEDVYPMSDVEIGMVYHTIKNINSAVYHDQFVYQLKYPGFEVDLFKRAVKLMTEKHPILRTGFAIEDFEEPVQIVYKQISLPVTHYDISDLEKKKQENYLELFIQQDRKSPFNPSFPPLWRMMIFLLGNNNICILLIFHHSIMDGWSVASLMTELNNTYLKLKSDPTFVPQKLKSSYRDFVLAQLTEKKKIEVAEYWRSELEDYKRLDISGLTGGKSNQVTQSERNIGFDKLEKLREVSRNCGTQIKNLFFAVYLYILNMLSFENDIVTGLVTNNRPACEDGDKIIGCFLNTPPFRIRIPGGIKWSQFIRMVDEKTVALKKYENISLFEIARIIGEKTGEQNPIFDTMYNYVDFYVYREADRDGVEVKKDEWLAVEGYENTNAIFDFSANMTLGGLNVILSYSGETFDNNLEKKLWNYFDNILDKIISEPDGVIVKSDLIPGEEKRKLLEEFNDTGNEYPKEKTIHELFEEQAFRTPGNVALVEVGKGRYDMPLTYKELNEKSDFVSAYLRSAGVGFGDIIAIMVESSVEMICGILGILKTGGAYLPIDPDFPRERINYMIKDSNAKVLIINKSEIRNPKFETNPHDQKINDQNKNQDFGAAFVLNFENLNVDIVSNFEFRASNFNSSNLAYVIYTSGSTGKPKGVMVEHRNAAAYFSAFFRIFDLNAEDTVIQLASFTFDAFVEEVFPVILRGGKLVIPARDDRINIHALGDLIVKHHVNIIDCTPLLLNEFDKLGIFAPCPDVGGIKYIFISGGDVLKEEYVKNLLAVGEVYNTYGPTESTVCATYSRYRGTEGGGGNGDSIPIGKPLSNYRVYILDRDCFLQPVGVPGEMCISGVGVTRGYLNRPELTAEKFKRVVISHSSLAVGSSKNLTNDPCPMAIDRLYKTGDFARWLPDGNIEFLGRIDQQVKIRGFRVELGEIENRLLQKEGIGNAVVVAKENEAGDKYLCAYITPSVGFEKNLSAQLLRNYLSETLPEYMVPNYFVALETFPLTTSGKVDRKALPIPGVGGEGEDYVAPANETEKKLVEIWADVLGLAGDKISVGSNFFELGGHSLKAIKVIAEIQKKLCVKISLSELFRLSTIKAISEFTRGAKRDIYKPIHPSEQKEYYPLTSAQKRMYFVEHITKDLSYNMPAVVRLEGIVDKDKLEWAFLKLIERHEGFRTSFEILEDNLVQVVHPMSRISFNIDFHETDEAGARELVNHFIRLFDMGKAPLLRVQLIKVGETQYVFMMDMHHIINDGISTSIMFEELGRLLSNEQLPEMKLQYKDYSEWQNGDEQLDAVKKQEEFWLNELGGELPVLNLPLDFPRPIVQNFEAEFVKFSIDSEETARLSKLAVEEKATLYIVLLSIFNILLAKLSGQEDILIGTPLGGRRHPDLDRIIGMFVDTLVLRDYPLGEKTFRAFLNEVKDRTFNAFENQQFEFDELVSRLGVERDISRNPIFDVMFEWENADEQESTETQNREINFTVHPYADYAYLLAKFDLALYVEKGRNTLSLTIRYCLKLFKKETIERFSIYLKKIVAEVVKNPGIKLSEIEILPGDEKKRILVEFNNTGHEYPKDKTINRLFEAQVERAPEDMAVVLPSIDQITYRELEKKSNGLAALLRENGVEPGTIVGIMVDRSIEMVIGLLGILKSGGVYLPLNPRNPSGRTRYMLKDSSAKIVLTHHGYGVELNDMCRIIDLGLQNLSVPWVLTEISSQNYAYLIYTSGSTGNPKGVPIAHSNFSPLVHWGYRVMGISGADRFLQNLSYFFDWSVWEIFLALTTGAGLYITGEEVLLGGEALSKFMCENKITVLHITPSQFQILAGGEVDGKPAKLESLKHLCFGAEKLTYDLVKRSIDMIPGDCRIYNMYGPTEATIIAAVSEINRNTPDKYEKYGSVPIGIPVGNTQLYVLDKYFNICPLNMAGELYIGGEGLSEGYVNNPELTAEKFNRTHRTHKTHICYKTGDLARWLPDGEVEFLGRIDYQVKIRGHRVELGEIENKLLEHEGVKVAVATVKGETDLCVYIVPKVQIADEAGFKAELKEYLVGRLPGYMIPSFIVLIKGITLTPNGKVDLRALPRPELVSLEEYVAPRDVVEEKLLKIWTDVLGKDPVKDRIGIDDSFFEVGGHSLKATILAAKLHKEFGVKVPLAEIFKAPRIRKLAEYIKSEGKDAYISIKPAEKKEYYLLSPAQKRLYVLQHMLIDNISYNMPNVIPLLENIEKEKLEATFKKLIERHESLRTSFITINGEPVQRINEKVDFTIGWYEIAGESEADHLITGFTRPFDLSITPLLRVNHVTIGSSRRVLFIDMHHIITDGVSQSILEKEFVVLYAGGELPPLRLQYKDYALWQNSAVQHTLIKGQETYWLNMFAEEVPALDIPFDYPRPAIQSFEGNSVEFPLAHEENQTLKNLAKEAGATLYMSILSVFTILLAKLSGQEDIIVGTAIAGRRHDDLEQIIGMFVNTLALRNYPVGEKTFPGYLQELKERTLGAFENQEYQFEELVEKISVSRDAGRNPLFDVMYNFLNRDEYPDRGKIRESHDPVSYIHRKETSKFDLSLEVLDLGERLALTFNYCTKLFTPATIERFISYFKNLLNLLSENPRQKLSQLEIIAEQEKRRILYDFNDTEAGYPGDKTIHRLFEEQAAAIPDHIALVGLGHGESGMGTREQHLAYRGLNEKASLLGRLLGQKGVKTDAIVGIIAERSVETIVGILGVLKAGGAYMPIDPNSPGERRRYMMADSSAAILLTAGDVLSMSTQETRVHHSSFIIHHSNNLAYIIYTSGTSGAPKGVMVEHRNVINLVEALNREIYISYHKALNICLISPYIFDASVKQVFVSLLLGHRLYITPGESRFDGEYLLDYYRKYHIEISDGTPAHLRLILENIKQEPAFPPVKEFIIGGEALKWNTVEEFLGKIGEGHLKISNIYGPTECTVDSSVYQINRLPDRRLIDVPDVPIGRPLSNCCLYIVDKAGRLQPIGIPGELCISGAGVSRGYLNQPAVTAEKFRVNPFPSPSPGTGKKRGLHRMYYSGDLARWEADGNIQFLGRIDRQVKIRGFRIELAEIENRLIKHPGITGALVLIREDHAGDRYLCAYIVCNKGVDFPGFAIFKNELKDYLSRSLPEYMIPGYITEVEAIPLTPSGKIDWRKLPGPVVKGEEGYHAPRDFTEKKLVELWAEVLGRDPLQETIGIDDNFFNLGGHSLKATILASQIQKEFEVKLPLVEIFRAPRIREMGEYIKSMVKSKYVSIEPAEERKYYALSTTQERLYILQQISVDSTSYNMPYVIPLPGDIDMDKLESTFKALIARHESLRTSFALKNEEPVQLIHRDVHFSIGNYEAAVDGELEKIMVEFVKPFDLSEAPLLRVNLLARGPRRRDLLIDMHHIITDGISQEILRKEFMALYAGEQLAPLRLQYKDYSQWQNSQIEKERLKQQESYWLNEFAGDIPILELPTDYLRPLIQAFDGDAVNIEIPGEETHALIALGLAEGATPFMVLAAMFNILLAKLSGQEDIIIGTPIAGRRHADLEKIIGMFVNTLVLRNYPIGEQIFKEFLKEVRERSLEAFENQEYPFEELVEKVGVNRDTGRNPLFDVMFTMQNVENISAGAQVDGEREQAEKGDDLENIFQTAKFDLTLTVVDVGAGPVRRLLFSFQYCTKLFKKETIECFARYFKNIVSIIIRDPGQKLKEIEIISEEEKQWLLFDFNNTKAEYPGDKTIHRLFAEQVEKTPDIIALAGIGYGPKGMTARDQHLTYNDLNKKSNRLAHYLLKQGIAGNEMAAIMTERSLEMIIGIMAILKAGGAYVPLDPKAPASRVKYILAECAVSMALTLCAADDEKNSSLFENRKCIYINEESHYAGMSSAQPVCSAAAESLAYVIFTSGSTGKPKGVPITHANFSPLLHWGYRRLGISPKDRVIQNLSYYFDWSVWEIFITLTTGAGLHIVHEDVLLNPEACIAFMAKHQITALHVTPTQYRYLLNATRGPAALNYLFIGAEKLSCDLAKRSFASVKPGCRVFNMYGPTECTIIAAVLELERPAGLTYENLSGIPIGQSAANMHFLILDNYLKLCPVNTAGELYIGGIGVARGYLNRPELTAEKFIKNRSYRSYKTYILYKTGDLVRWLPDGNVEFLGRLDQQVKIRGYRIELGEIESRLLAYPGIKDAVVLALEEAPGDKYLCAYIVSDTGYEIAGLREYLSNELPDYMIPAHFVKLGKIPFSPNGKVDRKALPEPGFASEAGKYTAPRNEIERKLIDIWSEILALEKEKIGCAANFFQLGGHSLKATVMVSKIYSEFGVRVPLVEVFKNPTAGKIGEYLLKEKTNMQEKILLGNDTRLVLLRKAADGKNGKHLFFIHDGTGEVEVYMEFCNRLNSEFNCWGIRADRMENLAPRNITIEELARNYIETIKKIQPNDHYYIAGWSLGGTIAFEIVAQLEQLKEKVSFLALIDSPPPYKKIWQEASQFNLESELRFLKDYAIPGKMKKKLKNMAGAGLAQFWLSVVEYLEASHFDVEMIKGAITGYGMQVLPNFQQLDIKESVYYLNVGRTLRNARALYTPPGKIHTPLHYIAAGESKNIPQKHWSDYCHGPITFSKTTGDHYSILRMPAVEEFAKSFDAILSNFAAKA